MTEPLVSIIIPLYNAKNYITETIESVIKQSYKNWELIVVDDCSTDDSVSIVEQYCNNDNRISILKSTTNFGGPARPRNMGIKASRGEYIAFLDSDDIWISDKLSQQISYMQNNNILICCTNIMLINSESDKIFRLSSKIKGFFLFFKKSFGLRFLLFSNQICNSSVVVSKSLLGDIIFDEDINLIATEDYYLWLTLSNRPENNTISRIKMSLVLYRIHNSNISGRKNIQLLRGDYCTSKFLLENEIKNNTGLFYFIGNLIRHYLA